MSERVYFGLGPDAARMVPEGSILVYPSTDSWNDFGFKTLCEYVLSEQGKTTSGTFRLAFVNGGEEVHEDIARQVKSGNAAPASQFSPFFSIQTGMERYRSIVQERGPSGAKELLSNLHDLVALNRTSPAPKWLDAALGSEHFHKSFLRASDTFFAYYHAAPVLDGLEYESFQTAPSALTLSFELAGFPSPHIFNFRFSSDSSPAKRFAVVIGNNGVGKSRALHEIASSVLEDRRTLHDGRGGRPQISRLLAIGTPGEAEHTFPQAYSPGQTTPYYRLAALETRSEDSLPNILIRLSRDRENLGTMQRWSIFEDAVEKVLPFDDLCLKARIDSLASSGVVPLRHLRSRGEQASANSIQMVDSTGTLYRLIDGNPVPLSSGQISFIRLAAQMSLFIENGTLVLLDEPETHLHPNLITDLVAIIDRILYLSGSIAIAATHSAYLVREVTRSQVHIVSISDPGRVTVVQPRLKTFGADVGAISQFVFGDSIVNRLINDLEAELDKSTDAAIRWLESVKEELSTEATMHLRREIERRSGRLQ
ncbi:AAA family ATPase [Paraburkholderia panacisoli]|uniref:AAA family ATPase n=1 Tax=Paraburkholderia panacisoli TaxID=2603818 RepID=A0A5B0GTH1_9BURK|nr:AAA family ATPase [Paraburkholderia panacisoli]KAA1006216.1 AAA family ATPase [Paraburkholderia panacisoli]